MRYFHVTVIKTDGTELHFEDTLENCFEWVRILDFDIVAGFQFAPQ
jgi:hypothetical protein